MGTMFTFGWVGTAEANSKRGIRLTEAAQSMYESAFLEMKQGNETTARRLLQVCNHLSNEAIRSNDRCVIWSMCQTKTAAGYFRPTPHIYCFNRECCVLFGSPEIIVAGKSKSDGCIGESTQQG